jgi:RNAse (barnase) inhibitor barstar
VAGNPKDSRHAGVYLISPDQRDLGLLQEGALAGTKAIVLAGRDLSGREEFFTAIARAVPFPDYFGRNWDAVYDCLTDPSVMAANGTVLVLDGFEAMANREPEQWTIALNVLGEACAFWRPLNDKLSVLLVGTPQHAPGVPLLPAHCFNA